jgi:hypothetical protein
VEKKGRDIPEEVLLQNNFTLKELWERHSDVENANDKMLKVGTNLERNMTKYRIVHFVP